MLRGDIRLSYGVHHPEVLGSFRRKQARKNVGSGGAHRDRYRQAPRAEAFPKTGEYAHVNCDGVR